MLNLLFMERRGSGFPTSDRSLRRVEKIHWRMQNRGIPSRIVRLIET